ncbi:MAG: ABC transporter permease [Acutalibacteraceae bacterium]|nr:ABC transporter permease [Acutalibacteraceae bacterium]
MRAVFKREFRSYFSTPIGFIILAVLYFFLGLYFSLIYSYGSPDISTVIVSMSTVIAFIMPVITMRLMSEDRRQKVDQALLTAPVSLTSIVMGKFFAALAVFAIGLAPTVIFEIIIASYVSVTVMSYIYSVLGILLLGSALISIGMFISSLTESSVVSAILTLVINILVLYMSSFASMINVTWIANIVEKAAFITAFQNFGETVFSVPDVVYFISISVAFLFLCVRSLDKRRWA